MQYIHQVSIPSFPLFFVAYCRREEPGNEARYPCNAIYHDLNDMSTISSPSFSLSLHWSPTTSLSLHRSPTHPFNAILWIQVFFSLSVRVCVRGTNVRLCVRVTNVRLCVRGANVRLYVLSFTQALASFGI